MATTAVNGFFRLGAVGRIPPANGGGGGKPTFNAQPAVRRLHSETDPSSPTLMTSGWESIDATWMTAFSAAGGSWTTQTGSSSFSKAARRPDRSLAVGASAKQSLMANRTGGAAENLDRLDGSTDRKLTEDQVHDRRPQ